MMIRLVLAVIVSSVTLSCTHHNSEKSCDTYAEVKLPVSVVSDWSSVAEGLQVSVGSTDHRYVNSELPDIIPTSEWKGTAWRGERIPAQLVLWTNDSVGKVSISVSDFISEDGKKIKADNTSAHFVRYVITDEFGAGCGFRDTADYKSSLSADVLDNVSHFNLSPNTTRPVWLSINVPFDAHPGTYKSKVKVLIDKEVSKELDFELKVSAYQLPAPSDWKFHLDLWQNPYAVARVTGVEPWSEQHWEALHPVMKMLADAGQKVITTTINKRPWNGQTEDAFDSMIAWVKKPDGSWKYDYTVFDNWVQFMMGLGVDKQINCYSMVPWGNFVFYYDEELKEEVRVAVAPGTPEYAEIWVPFLTDFILHLEVKGWKEITRIAMDERNPEEMKAMLAILNKSAPGIGVSFADNHQSYKLYPGQLYDLSVAHGTPVDKGDIGGRRNEGFVTSWYVCCTDSFPNVFTFSEPAEATFIGWYTMAAGFDGFLRWAYNSWVKEPLLDSRFRKWPAGDTYIVYPNGRSSIRFERLREGIQDAEKIRILREELKASDTAESKKKLQDLDTLLARFNVILRPTQLDELVREGKMFLDKLSFN